MKKKLNNIGQKFSEEKLIQFDFKSVIFIALCLFGFFLLVFFKIHGSSIAEWNNLISDGNNGKTGLLAGDSKAIRSDEWLVSTPLSLSQSKKGYPVKNENIGGNSDPLLMSLPVAHFSTLFRPQNWGYFLLGPERGFSLYWNFKIFGLLLSFFLLLMLLTGSNFWLSVFGSLWLFFSTFVQWWFSTSLPELMTNFSIIFISLVYIVLAQKRSFAFLGSIILAIATVNFVLFFYPPFQIPLLYLLVFLLLGFFYENINWKNLTEQIASRIYFLLAPGFVIVVALGLFYIDSKDTIAAIMGTVYPGNRISIGGELDVARVFSGYTLMPLSENQFPLAWSNASEAGNFILLFPVLLLAILRNFILKIKINKIIILLLGYSLFILAWALVRFPVVFAKFSLFSFVPANRVILVLGLASIIATIVFLSEKTEKRIANKAFDYSATALIFIALFFYGYLLMKIQYRFFHFMYILIMIIIFTVLALIVMKRKKVLFAIIIFPLVFIPTFQVNPIAIGLGPLYEKRLSAAAIDEAKKDPEAKWVVYGDGSFVYANFFKASGLNVLDGTNYTMNRASLKILDPGKNYENIYNRYAHISVVEKSDEGGDEAAEFNLISPDLYVIKINPCAEKLKKLDINYFAFTYQPKTENTSCLSPLGEIPINNIRLYRRK